MCVRSVSSSTWDEGGLGLAAMRGPVLKQAPNDVPAPRPFLKEHHQRSTVSFRSSCSTVQRGANPSRFIRCTMHRLRGACMCMAPNSISISPVKMWEMWHITHLGLLLGGGCGAAAMFCHLSGTSGTHPPEVKRWWGRIGKRYRRESPARG
jgi:hypothetical protein